MKKIFTFFIAMMLVSVFAFGQQGQVALGVNSQIDNVSWQDYRLVPTVGYFLSDNFMVGTGFSMASQKDGDEMTDTSAASLNTISAMSITPFVRYYINERLYASAGIDLTTSKDFSDNGYKYPTSSGSLATATSTYEEKESTFGFHAGIGYSLMYRDYICFEPAFVITSSGGSATNTAEYTDIFANGTPVVKNEVKQDAPSTFTMAIRLGINIRLGE